LVDATQDRVTQVNDKLTCSSMWAERSGQEVKIKVGDDLSIYLRINRNGNVVVQLCKNQMYNYDAGDWFFRKVGQATSETKGYFNWKFGSLNEAMLKINAFGQDNTYWR
jgi:hypothetical protein